jgi:hypothetical protein
MKMNEPTPYVMPDAEPIDYEQIEITSDCVCVAYDEETGDSMLDEDGEYVPAKECSGCYHDSIQLFNELILHPWLAANNLTTDSNVTVKAKHLGWQRTSAGGRVEASSLATRFALNGDFRLLFKLQNNELTMIRTSHDEPTGASFSFSA